MKHWKRVTDVSFRYQSIVCLGKGLSGTRFSSSLVESVVYLYRSSTQADLHRPYRLLRYRSLKRVPTPCFTNAFLLNQVRTLISQKASYSIFSSSNTYCPQYRKTVLWSSVGTTLSAEGLFFALSSSSFSSVPQSLSRHFHTSNKQAMAKSKFEYVKQFETEDACLPNCWIVVRVDGKAFHRFTDRHHYMKPNDERGLSLMTKAAQAVMNDFNEIVLAYGQSDEYSFVFHKNCKLYNRRASKIMSNVVSMFSSSFTLFWPRFFNALELQYPPSFDGRIVLYPSDDNLKDYLSWRQADCHINNLYNTCFWKLVQEKGLSPAQAGERLKGTLSSDKNELLFSEFNINYNNLPELYRKGTVVIRPKETDSVSPEVSFSNNHSGRANSAAHGKMSKKATSIILHTDIIGKKFWEDNPHILKLRT